jgi:AraC-like DNA-binding protein
MTRKSASPKMTLDPPISDDETNPLRTPSRRAFPFEKMKKNLGAFSTPFSGVGVEHAPLYSKKTANSFVLHEWGYLAENKGWNFDSVFSPFWRLYYNERGGHSISVGDRLIQLGPRRLVLVPPQCLMRCEGRAPAPHFWLHFSYSRGLADSSPRPVELAPESSELDLIRRLKNLRSLHPKALPEEQDLLLATALAFVVLSRQELVWQAPRPQFLEKLTEHIARHFSSPLKNTDLAKMAGMSESGLTRAFNDHLGVSPARHVLNVRISEATALLQHTAESMELIAEKTGFANRNYFSHMFKKATGVSPAEFRRIHRQKYGSSAS